MSVYFPLEVTTFSVKCTVLTLSIEVRTWVCYFAHNKGRGQDNTRIDTKIKNEGHTSFDTQNKQTQRGIFP